MIKILNGTPFTAIVCEWYKRSNNLGGCRSSRRTPCCTHSSFTTHYSNNQQQLRAEQFPEGRALLLLPPMLDILGDSSLFYNQHWWWISIRQCQSTMTPLSYTRRTHAFLFGRAQEEWVICWSCKTGWLRRVMVRWMKNIKVRERGFPTILGHTAQPPPTNQTVHSFSIDEWREESCRAASAAQSMSLLLIKPGNSFQSIVLLRVRRGRGTRGRRAAVCAN